jgi:hypothetical protein
LPPAPPPASTFARFEGSVADAATGAPLAGARVASRAAGGGAVRGVETDASGRFRFDSIPPGSYEVVAAAEGYLVSDPQRVDARASAPPPLRFALERGLSIGGVVVDEVSGDPVPGAELRLAGPDPRRYAGPFAPPHADGSGRFELRGVPAGEGYALAARAPGYLEGRLDLPPVRPPGGLSGVRLPLSRGARIAGRVLDPAGAPAPGAVVTVLAERAALEPRSSRPAGPDGAFVVEGLADGPYQVGAERDKEALAELRPVVVARGAGPLDLELRLATAPPIEGRVTDEAGEPAAGAEVSAERAGPLVARRSAVRTRSGADGTFSLDAGPGRFALRARKAGYRAATALDLPGGSKGVVLALEKGAGTGAVRGRLAAAGGKPLAGVTLRFDLAGGEDADGIEVRTGTSGELSVDAVTAGTYTVSFVEPGTPEGELRVRAREVELAPGAAVDLSLEESEPRGTIAGIVRLAAGLPPAAEPIEVNLRPAERPRDRFGFLAATGAHPDGAFRFGAVPPGKYVLTATADGLRGEATVEVPPGGAARADLTIE